MRNDDKISRDGRKLALGIVACAFVFIGIEYAGATYGWSNKTMGLLELGIAAIFLWVMIKAVMMWRARHHDGNG